MPTSEQSLKSAPEVLRQISEAVFNTRSLFVLAIMVLGGVLLGRLISIIVGNVSQSVGRRADKSSDRATVKRLRRIETWLVLSTALVRILFVAIGLYLWWQLTHPAGKSSALIGASAAVALLLNGVFSPLLRDIAFGSGMMAEQWFGVGDLVTIVPFDAYGVVQRITLRSTKIKTMNGDTLWITNQNIAGVLVSRTGVRTIALELFVSDEKKIEELVERTNDLLPDGPSLLVSPLTIMSREQRDKHIWRVIAIGETAPGREYLIEKNATDILKASDDQKKPILLSEPIHRYADSYVERQFGRAINNARKKERPSNLLQLPGNIRYLRHRITDSKGAKVIKTKTAVQPKPPAKR